MQQEGNEATIAYDIDKEETKKRILSSYEAYIQYMSTSEIPSRNEINMLAYHESIRNDAVFDLWYTRVFDQKFSFIGVECFDVLNGLIGVMYRFSGTGNVLGSVMTPNFLVMVEIISRPERPRGNFKLLEVDFVTPTDGSILRAGLNISGESDVTVSFHETTITLSGSASARIKYGRTVLFQGTENITISKDIRELTPCVNINQTTRAFEVRGELCFEGSNICFDKGELFVNYRGHHKVANIPRVCVNVRG